MEAQAQKTERLSFLMRVLGVAALVVLCLGIVDATLRLTLPQVEFFQHPVDIQSPEMLAVKLDALKDFKGKKVVVLGDSLAFGRAMREHGDKDWQGHTLSAQLRDALEASYPDQDIMVLNLGMNGVVPMDLQQLVRIVLPYKPDLIVFDVTLRSFSRDFDTDRERMSRPWLANAASDNVMAKFWYLYRVRDTLQALVFDGQPVLWTTRMRDSLDSWFKGGAFAPPKGDEFILLLKARNRYDRIDLEADNPQRQAMEALLEDLQRAEQPTLAFYATEDSSKLEELMGKTRYDALQAQLSGIMTEGDKTVDWVGPLSIYKPAHYLDHVHLDKEGYALLVQYLLPRVETMLFKGQD